MNLEREIDKNRRKRKTLETESAKQKRIEKTEGRVYPKTVPI